MLSVAFVQSYNLILNWLPIVLSEGACVKTYRLAPFSFVFFRIKVFIITDNFVPKMLGINNVLTLCFCSLLRILVKIFGGQTLHAGGGAEMRLMRWSVFAILVERLCKF